MFFHFWVSTHLAVTLPVDPLWLLKFVPFWNQTDAKFTVKLVHKSRAAFWCILGRFGIPYGVHLGSLLGTQNWAVSNLKCNQASEWVPPAPFGVNGAQLGSPGSNLGPPRGHSGASLGQFCIICEQF